jgi:hypothetical protein
MWYPYDDANWSALDRDYAANACHDIEWDCRRPNDSVANATSEERGASFRSFPPRDHPQA